MRGVTILRPKAVVHSPEMVSANKAFAARSGKQARKGVLSFHGRWIQRKHESGVVCTDFVIVCHITITNHWISGNQSHASVVVRHSNGSYYANGSVARS